IALEVDGDALLVAVEVDEEARLAGVRHVSRKRAQAPRVVARGRLDLDDLRAEVSEQLRAIGARYPLRQVDNPDAFQGEFGQCSSPSVDTGRMIAGWLRGVRSRARMQAKPRPRAHATLRRR